MIDFRSRTVFSVFARRFVELAAAGVACHLIFHHFEPRHPLIHLALLLGIPVLLSSSPPVWYGSRVYTACISIGVYLSSLIISTIMYRLSPFHPLARYPGPILARVTKLWSLRVALPGKSHQRYKALHERYGDIVRTGPNELSFNDTSVIEPMMGMHGMPKGPFWESPVTSATPNLVSIRDRKEHARRRKPWTRGLNAESLKGYESTLKRRVSQLVEKLAAEAEKGDVNLVHWIHMFAYDFMNDMAFGGGSDLMKYGDRDGLRKMLADAIPGGYFLRLLPWLIFYVVRLPWLAKTIKVYRDYAIERATLRKQHGSVNKDLFYHLIDEGGTGNHPPSMEEVVSNASLAIIAGADTTSTTINNIFYYLMTDLEVYRKLQAEVDSFFPLGEDATDVAKQAKMPYLNAVINEVLRLLPALLGGSQRGPAKGSGGHMLGQHFIPEETNVFVHTYSLHRDPRNFSMPDRFWPERWLISADASAEDEVLRSQSDTGRITHNASAFIPFGTGPANCVGRALALMEVRMVLCAVLQAFVVRLADPNQAKSWEENLMNFGVMVQAGLHCVLQKRTRD